MGGNMASFTFTITGDPIPWARATPNYTQRYMYDCQKAIKSVIRDQLTEAMGNQAMLKGPLELVIYYYFSIPASLSKVKQNALLGTPYTSAPDIDNCTKFLLDTVKNIVIRDDRYVWKEECYKLYDWIPRTDFTFKESQE